VSGERLEPPDDDERKRRRELRIVPQRLDVRNGIVREMQYRNPVVALILHGTERQELQADDDRRD
jgi:hypothetical protein